MISEPCPPPAGNAEGDPFASNWHLLALGLVRSVDEVSVEVHADVPVKQVIAAAIRNGWMQRGIIATTSEVHPSCQRHACAEGIRGRFTDQPSLMN